MCLQGFMVQSSDQQVEIESSLGTNLGVRNGTVCRERHFNSFEAKGKFFTLAYFMWLLLFKGGGEVLLMKTEIWIEMKEATRFLSHLLIFFSNFIAFSLPRSAIVAMGPLQLHLGAESANTAKLCFLQKDLV